MAKWITDWPRQSSLEPPGVPTFTERTRMRRKRNQCVGEVCEEFNFRSASRPRALRRCATTVRCCWDRLALQSGPSKARIEFRVVCFVPCFHDPLARDRQGRARKHRKLVPTSTLSAYIVFSSGDARTFLHAKVAP